MKAWNLLSVCLLLSAYTHAHASAAQTQQAVEPSNGAESALSAGASAETAPRPGKHGRNPMLQSNFSSIKRGVVKQMRATSAFVQQEAAKPGALDDWLIVLTAFGLIVLQLRRKHKSLPQRRITPYG
jgi:hypothetical protein